MTDEEFLAAFDAGQLDPGSFPHAAHVRAAWLCLRETPFSDGIGRLRRGLKQLAIRAGQPGHYHETITVAFARLIHEKMHALGPHAWTQFSRDAPEFFTDGRGLLATLYDPATLASDEARQHFVAPPAWRSVPWPSDAGPRDAAPRDAGTRAPAVAIDDDLAIAEPVSAMAVLAVASVEQSLTWYARVFGFDATTYPERPPYHLALLTRGGAEVMLREAATGVTAPDGWALCIRLSGGGIAAMHAALVTAGDRVSPLRELPDRDVEFEVHDPDGYVVLVREFVLDGEI